MPPARRAWSIREAIVSWGPALAVAGAIVALSSVPGDRLELPLFPHADKLAHLAVYGLLGLLVLRALARTTRLALATRAFVTVVLVTVFGVTDELHQVFVPGRSAEVLDVVADGAGALLACVVFWAGGRLARRRGAVNAR